MGGAGIFNASIAFQGASGAGHIIVENTIVNSTAGAALLGCEPGCAPNPPGDTFASNMISGNRSHTGVGHQGPFANNWLYDNHHEGTTGDWFTAYMQVYPTTEVSLFDPVRRTLLVGRDICCSNAFKDGSATVSAENKRF